MQDPRVVGKKLSPDHRQATHWVQHTTSRIAQSNAPEDGKNCCPKHVELIWIIKKPLMLHLVGFLLYHRYKRELRHKYLRTAIFFDTKLLSFASNADYVPLTPYKSYYGNEQTAASSNGSNPCA
jgi:hypothetical protein